MSYFVSVEPTSERKNGYVVHKCVCSCGNVCYKKTSDLSKSTMCPTCARKFRNKKIEKHGLYARNKRLARLCYGAYKRCNDPSVNGYENYGGRGIKFKFDSIEHMFNWSIENGYSDNLSIDRIDVNGNYEPSNCRWISMEEQASNKTNTVRLNGICGIKNISEYLGITSKQLSNYLYKKKLTIEEVYELYKTDPNFHGTHSDKNSVSQRKRKDQLVISKEEAINIVNNIKNGSTSWKESKRLGKDHITIKRAIKRLEDGYYD